MLILHHICQNTYHYLLVNLFSLVIFEHPHNFHEAYTIIILFATSKYSSHSAPKVSWCLQLTEGLNWLTQGLQFDLDLAEITCVAWFLLMVITLNS